MLENSTYSIVIPLEQGLRPLFVVAVVRELRFYCHSIRTRIKTLCAPEWDTYFLPCRLSRRFEFGKVWAKQFISSFFYFKILEKPTCLHENACKPSVYRGCAVL